MVPVLTINRTGVSVIDIVSKFFAKSLLLTLRVDCSSLKRGLQFDSESIVCAWAYESDSRVVAEFVRVLA